MPFKNNLPGCAASGCTCAGGGGTVTVSGCCGIPAKAIPTVLHLTAANTVPPPGWTSGSALFVDATLTYLAPINPSPSNPNPGPFGPPDDPTCCTLVPGNFTSCAGFWWSPLMEAGKRLTAYCPTGSETCLGYHYIMGCGSTISLQIVLRTSGSGAQRELGNQQWTPSASGNSCTTFLMVNPDFAHASSAYLGQADITISG